VLTNREGNAEATARNAGRAWGFGSIGALRPARIVAVMVALLVLEAALAPH
jgi:hypothetical protein